MLESKHYSIFSFLLSLMLLILVCLFVHLSSSADLTQVLTSAGQILTTQPHPGVFQALSGGGPLSPHTKCCVLQAPPPAICQTSSVVDGQSLDQYLAHGSCSGNICAWLSKYNELSHCSKATRKQLSVNWPQSEWANVVARGGWLDRVKDFPEPHGLQPLEGLSGFRPHRQADLHAFSHWRKQGSLHPKVSVQPHASLAAAPDTPKGFTLLWETAEVPA